MKAMILAAGKGERMMPLTRRTPKPLLKVADKFLIQYQLEALQKASVHELIINTGRYGKKFEDILGDGAEFGLKIIYSHEGEEPLGIGSGVQKVLHMLGDSPFILLNGDIWTDFNYSTLQLSQEKIAHIVMVRNPEHNQDGDFALDKGCVIEKGQEMLTFSGVGIYQPSFFCMGEKRMFSFVSALKRRIREQKVSGELYNGRWYDIGTPERLQALNKKTKI